MEKSQDKPQLKTKIACQTLYSYQQTAVQWMMEREEDEDVCGGLLCDEMGLGKSITAIGLLANSRVQRTLLVAPLAVLYQWEQLCVDHGFVTYTVKNKSWQKHKGPKTDWRKGHVFIINYDKLCKSNESLFIEPFDRLICDEAHVLRNPEGKARQWIQDLAIPRKWFLSGTPIVNSLTDIQSLACLLNSRIFGRQVFTESVATAFMNTYALGRTRKMVQKTKDFPQDPEIIEHSLEFTSELEALMYRGIQGRLEQELEQLLQQHNIHMEEILTLILRLRQMSVHPQVYIESKRRTNPHFARPDWLHHSTKTEAILNILRQETKSHRFVIFCNFKDEIRMLKTLLENENCVEKVLVYDGSLSQEKREQVLNKTREPLMIEPKANAETLLEGLPWLSYDVYRIIDSFLKPRHTILLAQIQSAGTGLNLQHMDRVIFTSYWWTAALMDQAIARVVRIGQTQPVKIHRLMLAEEERLSMNIDRYMAHKVNHKRRLCEVILEACGHMV